MGQEVGAFFGVSDRTSGFKRYVFLTCTCFARLDRTALYPALYIAGLVVTRYRIFQFELLDVGEKFDEVIQVGPLWGKNVVRNGPKGQNG